MYLGSTALFSMGATGLGANMADQGKNEVKLKWDPLKSNRVSLCSARALRVEWIFLRFSEIWFRNNVL